jgi:hypothetical protein
MSSIQLLEVVRSDVALKVQYDNLYVSDWSSGHWSRHSINALLNICHRLKIRMIIFVPPNADTTLDGFDRIDLIGKFSCDKIPFLPYLRIIRMEDGEWHPAVATLIAYSRVKELHWFLKGRDLDDCSCEINDIFIQLGIAGDILFERKSIQEIIMWREVWSDEKSELIPLWNGNEFIGIGIGPIGKQTGKKCAIWLEQNRIGWKKCREACLILLGLKKRRDRMFNLVAIDVMKIVVSMVWDTRGTKVWTE